MYSSNKDEEFIFGEAKANELIGAAIERPNSEFVGVDS